MANLSRDEHWTEVLKPAVRGKEPLIRHGKIELKFRCTSNTRITGTEEDEAKEQETLSYPVGRKGLPNRYGHRYGHRYGYAC